MQDRLGLYQRLLKRPLDFFLALFAVVLLIPLFVVLSILIRTRLGSPILFRQTRPGLHGKLFIIYKFRTMTNEKDESGKLLPDTVRLTKLGRFLRSSSMDELPELWNILKGDMSFIGPRPLLTEYLPRYTKEQLRRHDVRPGLSGLAQVNGRNKLSWEDKFNLDIEYVNGVTFHKDLIIFIRTIKKVFIREGIHSETSETMELFQGKKQLIIIGASGHGRSAADVAIKCDLWQRIAFLDDHAQYCGINGIDVIGKLSDAPHYISNSDFFVAIGNNAIREAIQYQLEELGAHLATIIHPNAIIGTQVTLGCGTVVMAGVVINCNTHIGMGCIINTGATVDHDNEIGDYVHISPGSHLAGTVKVQEGTWLGTGSIVINDVSITDHCIIGAGALVLKSISEPGTYVGIPARNVSNVSN